MIYLVRHGQTEFNLMQRYQGALDSPLTEQGREQGRRLGALLGDLTGNGSGWALVSSPLGRAQATAALIRDALDPGMAIETDGRLREISLGSWDGLTDEDIAMVSPGVLDGVDRFAWQFMSPDGETYDAVGVRLAEWLDDARASGRKLIVVSHGIAGLILRGLYAGETREAAMRAGAPQDAVFRLAEGRVERIDAP